MAVHDIIAIGTSAGGVEALKTIVASLPADLPATVMVTMHLSARSRSHLPAILAGAGNLTAIHARDGTPVERGVIYVAPPDLHLAVRCEHFHLSHGPKEQRHRPSVNVMFRSAAQVYGERVIGVVLTGELDDGTAGLWEIKRRGGVAVVQDPEEASSPSMPLNALREVDADYVAKLNEIGPLLTRLCCGGADRRTKLESREMEPVLTDLTCPDCRGTIWETRRGNSVEYSCRTAHTYSPATMLECHFDTQEKALYAAIVALEEGASLSIRLAENLQGEDRDRLRAEAQERREQAEQLRAMLRGLRGFTPEGPAAPTTLSTQ